MRRSIQIIAAFLLSAIGAPGMTQEIETVDHALSLCDTSTYRNLAENTVMSASPMEAMRARHEYALTRHRRLMGVYAVTMRPRDYGFLPATEDLLNSGDDTLAIDAADPFQLFGGLFALNLARTSSIEFPVGSEGSELRTAHGADELLLRIYFQLSSMESPFDDYCRRNGDLQTIIDGRLLAAELVTRDEAVIAARIETPHLRSQRIQFSARLTVQSEPLVPRVLVTSTAVIEDESDPSAQQPTEELEYLTLESESLLLPCYVRALASNGRLRGALVATYRVDEEGTVDRPAISIDAVGDERISTCVTDALDEIVLPRKGQSNSYGIRMTVVFSLDQPEERRPTSQQVTETPIDDNGVLEKLKRAEQFLNEAY